MSGFATTRKNPLTVLLISLITIPENLDRYGDALVGWDSKNLIDAIQGKHKDWVTPEGNPRKGRWDADRSNC